MTEKLYLIETREGAWSTPFASLDAVREAVEADNYSGLVTIYEYARIQPKTYRVDHEWRWELADEIAGVPV